MESVKLVNPGLRKRSGFLHYLEPWYGWYQNGRDMVLWYWLGYDMVNLKLHIVVMPWHSGNELVMNVVMIG